MSMGTDNCDVCISVKAVDAEKTMAIFNDAGAYVTSKFVDRDTPGIVIISVPDVPNMAQAERKALLDAGIVCSGNHTNGDNYCGQEFAIIDGTQYSVLSPDHVGPCLMINNNADPDEDARASGRDYFAALDRVIDDFAKYSSQYGGDTQQLEDTDGSLATDE